MFWNQFKLGTTPRNANNLQCVFYSKQICESSIRYSGPTFWNKLPELIKVARSIYSFKYRIKRYILSKSVTNL